MVRFHRIIYKQGSLSNMNSYQFSTYQDFRIYQFSYMHESKLETLYEQLCDFHEYERKLEKRLHVSSNSLEGLNLIYGSKEAMDKAIQGGNVVPLLVNPSNLVEVILQQDVRTIRCRAYVGATGEWVALEPELNHHESYLAQQG